MFFNNLFINSLDENHATNLSFGSQFFRKCFYFMFCVCENFSNNNSGRKPTQWGTPPILTLYFMDRESKLFTFYHKNVICKFLLKSLSYWLKPWPRWKLHFKKFSSTFFFSRSQLGSKDTTIARLNRLTFFYWYFEQVFQRKYTFFVCTNQFGGLLSLQPLFNFFCSFSRFVSHRSNDTCLCN